MSFPIVLSSVKCSDVTILKRLYSGLCTLYSFSKKVSFSKTMSTMNLYCIFSGSSDLGYWIFVRFDIGLKQNIWVNMIQVWRRIRVRNMCCAAARLHTRHSSSPSQAPVSARCCDNVFMFCGNYLPTFTYKYRLLLP